MITFYLDTNIEIEVGDIIQLANPYRKCKFKEKTQTIRLISNTGKSVWYNDKRTNNKCKCGRCLDLERTKGRVNITLDKIKLFQKGSEKLREDKLKLLLKEN